MQTSHFLLKGFKHGYIKYKLILYFLKKGVLIMTDFNKSIVKFVYTKQEIVELVLKDIEKKTGLKLTRKDVSIFKDDTSMFFFNNFNTQNIEIPPCYYAEEWTDIINLLNWAYRNNQIIEIVYEKEVKGVLEVSSRIIHITSIENSTIETHCYVTSKEEQIIKHTSNDSFRKFAINNITKARISHL